jgi:uncharacterized membrane protein YgcG
MPKHFYRKVVACCMIAALYGCRSSDTTEDRDPSVPPPPEGVQVQVLQDKQVRLLTPEVKFDDGVMTVIGYVRRRPGVRTVLSGRIDIDVLDTEGNVLDWIPALLYPNPVPTEGRGEAGYVIHYGWIPPAGSIVKVRFVDSKTAIIEDTSDSETIGGSYGSHSGGGRSGGGGHHHGM